MVDRELYVLLWVDDGEPQAAVYEDWEQADRDAELVDGHVEPRMLHLAPERRAGRFERPQG